MELHEYQTMARVEQRHPWFLNRRRLVRGLIRRFAAHISCPRILDAGSGTGVNLAEYATIGRAFGVELDHTAAVTSMARGRHRVAVGNLCRLPFRNAWFDVVTSTDVIEHIEDDTAALAELRRVLAPRGRILLTTPAYSWAYSRHDQFLHHVRRYDWGRLLRTIHGAGLKVSHASRYNVLLSGPLVAARWLGDRLAGTGSNGSDVGRPVPRLASPILDFVWRLEATVAPRVNWKIGLTHVVVLSHGS
jgi:SAM-dependent methyltransferase